MAVVRLDFLAGRGDSRYFLRAVLRVRAQSRVQRAFAWGAMAVGGALAWSIRANAEPSDLPPQVGYNYSQIETARTAALGGAGRAFGSSIDALHSNPANMVASRVYHVAGLAQFWSKAQQQTFTVSVVDSVASRSRLAGGISVSWLFQDPDGLDRKARDVRGALALPVSDRISIGVAGRYLDLSQSGYPRTRGVLPPSVASSGLRGESMLKEFSVDAGVTLTPVDNFRIALVGTNLTDPGHSLLPLTFGGGAGFGTGLFTVEADFRADFTTYDETTYRSGGGLEVLAADRYPLRIGYGFDQGQESHALSAGAGYVSREFSVDATYRWALSETAPSGFFLVLRYHAESMGLGR